MHWVYGVWVEYNGLNLKQLAHFSQQHHFSQSVTENNS